MSTEWHITTWFIFFEIFEAIQKGKTNIHHIKIVNDRSWVF